MLFPMLGYYFFHGCLGYCLILWDSASSGTRLVSQLCTPKARSQYNKVREFKGISYLRAIWPPSFYLALRFLIQWHNVHPISNITILGRDPTKWRRAFFLWTSRGMLFSSGLEWPSEGSSKCEKNHKCGVVVYMRMNMVRAENIDILCNFYHLPHLFHPLIILWKSIQYTYIEHIFCIPVSKLDAGGTD